MALRGAAPANASELIVAVLPETGGYVIPAPF